MIPNGIIRVNDMGPWSSVAGAYGISITSTNVLYAALTLWIISPFSCAIVSNVSKPLPDAHGLKGLLSPNSNNTGKADSLKVSLDRPIRYSRRKRPSTYISAQDLQAKKSSMIHQIKHNAPDTSQSLIPNGFWDDGSGDDDEMFQPSIKSFSLNPHTFGDDEDFLSDGAAFPSGSGAGTDDIAPFDITAGRELVHPYEMPANPEFAVINDPDSFQQESPSKIATGYSDHKIEHVVPKAPMAGGNMCSRQLSSLSRTVLIMLMLAILSWRWC